MIRSTALLAVLVIAPVGCGPSISDEYEQSRAEAMRAYTHGRYAESSAHWQATARAAGSRRRGYEALYRAGAASRRAGRNDEAKRLFSRIVRESPGHSRAARAAYELADLDIDAGREEAGHAKLRQFLFDYPGSGLASGALRRVLADIEDRQGEAAVGSTLLSFVPRLEKTDLGEHVHYAYAKFLQGQKRPQEALARFLLVADRYPYPHGALWDDALWNAAELELELKHPRRAVVHLERMLGQREPSSFTGSYERPRYSASRYRIGEIYRDQLKDPVQARRAFHEVWVSHPTSTSRDDAAWNEARLAHAAGDQGAACTALEALEDELPDSRFTPCSHLLCRRMKAHPRRECRSYIRRQLEGEDVEAAWSDSEPEPVPAPAQP